MNGNPSKKINPNRVGSVRDLKELWEWNKNTYGPQKYFSYKKDKAVVDITYNEIHEIIQKIGTAFYKIGVMGKNIAILSETRYEWHTCYLATTNGNGIVVPLDRELPEEQILNFIERAKVTCVVYSGAYAKFIEDYAKNTGIAERPDKKARVFIKKSEE